MTARIVSAINARLDRYRTPAGSSRFWASKRWSVENWLKGFRYGPIQRCRWCDHTTPHHYDTCRKAEVSG